VVPGATSTASSGHGSGGHGPATGNGTGGSGGGTGSTTGSAASTAPNGPPVILTFGTNVPSVTEGEQVQLTAVITDPDGIDDVIGGNLVDDATGATFGAFVTTAQEGAYQFSLSWDQLNQVATIDFASGATIERKVTAQFFDQAGHSVEKTTGVTLTCKGLAACAGACVNVTNDPSNCGSCGRACAAGPCDSGKCAGWTACLSPAPTTCAAYCAAHSATCSNSCANLYYGIASGVEQFANATCTKASNSGYCNATILGYGARCCCAQ
jgi:hypothetical protein